MTMTSLHQQRTHPEYVEGCFGCKAGSLVLDTADRGSRQYRFAASVTPEADMNAYARLRRQGLQPPKINGCATLERHADHEYEITRGKLYPGQRGRQLKEAITMLDDGGFNPTMAYTDPKPVEE